MLCKVKIDVINWGVYKQDFIVNCDFIKFEDGLKMCISCILVQCEVIVEYFSSQEQVGWIFFGVYVLGVVLIICMIIVYQLEYIYFIDGVDGGYSLVVLDLKKKCGM